MIYEEAIVDGVLCWRNSPRDCKGHGPWIPKTPQELTAMLMEARRTAAEKQPERLRYIAPGVVIQPVVVSKPQEIPDYQNPPWTVTC